MVPAFYDPDVDRALDFDCGGLQLAVRLHVFACWCGWLFVQDNMCAYACMRVVLACRVFPRPRLFVGWLYKVICYRATRVRGGERVRWGWRVVRYVAMWARGVCARGGCGVAVGMGDVVTGGEGNRALGQRGWCTSGAN